MRKRRWHVQPNCWRSHANAVYGTSRRTIHCRASCNAWRRRRAWPCRPIIGRETGLARMESARQCENCAHWRLLNPPIAWRHPVRASKRQRHSKTLRQIHRPVTDPGKGIAMRVTSRPAGLPSKGPGAHLATPGRSIPQFLARARSAARSPRVFTHSPLPKNIWKFRQKISLWEIPGVIRPESWSSTSGLGRKAARRPSAPPTTVLRGGGHRRDHSSLSGHSAARHSREQVIWRGVSGRTVQRVVRLLFSRETGHRKLKASVRRRLSHPVR